MSHPNSNVYEALGRVSAAFGSVEMVLQFLCWRLINSGNAEAGEAVTWELHFRGLYRLLARLSQQSGVSPEHRRRGKQLSRTAEKLSKRRNEAMHSFGAESSQGPRLVRVRDVVRQTATEPTGAAELEKLRRECTRLQDDLFQLNSDIAAGRAVSHGRGDKERNSE